MYKISTLFSKSKRLKTIFVTAGIVMILAIFSGFAYSAEVKMAWDPNLQAELAGYKLYQGPESGNYTSSVDVGNQTEYTFYNLEVGRVYYFAATAYDHDGEETTYSNEASYMAPNVPITHTITADSGENGSISPSGSQTVADGADMTFTIEAEFGYRIADVVVDGVSVGPVASYTFTDIDGDYNLTAGFEADTQADEVFLDNGDDGASSTGTWKVSGGINPIGDSSFYTKESGATYTFQAEINGYNEVSMWWTYYSNRCTDIPVEIYDGQTLLDTVYIDQQANGGQWNLLGTYKFDNLARVVILSEGGCSVSADAVKFVKESEIPPEVESPQEIMIDNGENGTSSIGSWRNSIGADPYGDSSLYSMEPDTSYTFETEVSGYHEVSMWWTEYSNRCADVPVEIYDGQTLLDTVYIDQLSDGGQWNVLGTFEFTGPARVVIISEGGCSVSADAVRFVEKSEIPPEVELPQVILIDNGENGTSSIGSWRNSIGADPYGDSSLYSMEPDTTYTFETEVSGYHEVSMWWTEYSNRCIDTPVEIYDGQTLLDTVYIDQQTDGGQWNVLGTYEFTGSARVGIISEGGCSASADAVKFAEKSEIPQTILIDNGEYDTSSIGSWRNSSGADPYGDSSLYSFEPGAYYMFEAGVNGYHEVSIWWTYYSNRCTDTPVEIYDGQTLIDTVYVDQLAHGGHWNVLGTYEFTETAIIVIISQGECSTSADAARIVYRP